MILFLIINSLWWGPPGESLHDFHLSKTDIHYKSEKEALQLTLHIFTDDLELAIEEKSGINPRLFTRWETPNADSLVADYIGSRLYIELDERAWWPEYLGIEISEDLQATWVYLEVTGVSPWKMIFVENRILLETYDDQKNIVNVKVDKKTIGYELFDKRDYDELIRI